MKLLMILIILLCKGTCALVAPSFKVHGGQYPRNAPPFWRPWLCAKE